MVDIFSFTELFSADWNLYFGTKYRMEHIGYMDLKLFLSRSKID